LRALEDENRRLKRVVADEALNIEALKELMQERASPSRLATNSLRVSREGLRGV